MTDSSPNLDAVAEAMWHDQNGDPFSTADSGERGHYLRMAQAAIDALGLTEETRADGVRSGGITHFPRTVARRLVSPWVRSDA